MRKALLLSATLSLTACAGNQAIVTTPPAQCSRLIPASWSTPIPSEPIPADIDITDWIGVPLTAAMAAAISAPWAKAYVGSDGQLDKANGRTVDAIGIMTECERLTNAARVDRK